MEIGKTAQKLRNLGYNVNHNGNFISINVLENTLSVNFYNTYSLYLNIRSNGQSITYSKWIRDHHNILNGSMVIHTFDELLVAISRTTLMGG
jgi:hypothetical protein